MRIVSRPHPWARRSASPSTTRRTPGSRARTLLLLALGLLLLLLIAASGLAYYSSRYNGRIFPGVTAMGVDLSGRTHEQARQALLDRAAVYGDSTLVLRQGDRTWTVSPSVLGLQLDVQPLLTQASQRGRTGSALEQWRQRLPLINQPQVLNPSYTLPRARVESYLQTVAAEIYRAPVASRLTLRPDGTFVASTDLAGEQLDLAAATDQLYNQVSGLRAEERLLPVLAIQPSKKLDDWRNSADLRRLGAARPATLTHKGEEWTLTPKQLAGVITVSPDSGNAVVGSFDSKKVEALLAPVATDIRRVPVDATLKIRGAKPVLTRERLGERLKVGATASELIASLPSRRSASLVTVPIPARLTARDLTPAHSKLKAILSESLTVTLRDQTWRVSTQSLAGWTDLSISKSDRTASVAVNQADVRRYVEWLAPQVRRQPTMAWLEVEDSKPLLTRERVGEQLNVAATVGALTAAIPTTHKTSLVMSSIPPPLTAKDLAPTRKKLAVLLGSPFTLTFGDESWTVPVETLADWTHLTVDLEGRSAAVRLDRDDITEYLQDLAPTIYRKPENGVLTWKDKLVVLKHSVDGHSLHVSKAADKLLAMAFTGKRSLVLPTLVVKPRVPTDNLAAMGIKEPIGEGYSEFGGSLPARVHNIHTSAAYIDNTVIAPGETFSFNKYVGKISIPRGYQQGLIIKGEETVPGIGGGVCQVSTTVFRAAFWAGMPIVERHKHGYLVPFYQKDGSPPGFDAAILRYHLDLRWTNTTDKYILLQAYWSNNSLRVILFGTDPDLTVRRSKAYISNRRPPKPTRIIIDPTKPPGYREQVDWAHEGMDVTIWRTVSKNGKVLFKDSFQCNYRPWAAAYKIGPPRLRPRVAVPLIDYSSVQDNNR